MLEGGHSGRRFVLAAGITVLLIWGTLYLFFRDWRAKIPRTGSLWDDAGCPAIEPLRPLMPPDVDPVAWRDAVDQTRAMLVTVTSSNLLDVKEMDALRRRADRARASGSAVSPRPPWKSWPRSGTKWPTAASSCSRTADRSRANGTRDPRSCRRSLKSLLEPGRPCRYVESRPAPHVE